jgi:hypothetical protein
MLGCWSESKANIATYLVKEDYENPNRYNFFIANDARWSVLAGTSEKRNKQTNRNTKLETISNF